MSIRSYANIYNVGHPAVREIFSHPVLIEEKVDGSQFSFGLRDGAVVCRSKGKEQTYGTDKLFNRAVEYAHSIKDRLVEGWTYRGEVLDTPRHNTLSYNRVPANHIVIFDIDTGYEEYLPPDARKDAAAELGLETVPVYCVAPAAASLAALSELLDRESFLGGPKVEGVVIKSLELYGPDKKRLMAKHVSEAFKEVHQGEWKKNNPTKRDLVSNIIDMYRVEARWEKAVQHLRESGLLLDAPQDIGPLMKEVSLDVLKEEEEVIKSILWRQMWPKISRGITAGLPEWYKAKLLEKQFEEVS